MKSKVSKPYTKLAAVVLTTRNGKTMVFNPVATVEVFIDGKTVYEYFFELKPKRKGL